MEKPNNNSDDTFSMSFRLLSNEIVGFSLSSSGKRDMMIKGAFVFVLVAIGVSELWPVIEEMYYATTQQ